MTIPGDTVLTMASQVSIEDTEHGKQLTINGQHFPWYLSTEGPTIQHARNAGQFDILLLPVVVDQTGRATGIPASKGTNVTSFGDVRIILTASVGDNDPHQLGTFTLPISAVAGEPTPGEATPTLTIQGHALPHTLAQALRDVADHLDGHPNPQASENPATPS